MKQPWEMTQKEWDKERRAIQPEHFGSSTKGGASLAVHRISRLEFLLYGICDPDGPVFHRDVIKKAFAEGKPISAENLKLYGLKRKS